MKVSFPAWDGTHYVSLAELLSRFGHCFGDADWYLRIDEAASEPGGDALESIDPEKPILFEELTRLVAPDIQIIDGEVNAMDRNGCRCLSISAIDSTWWDVETENSEVISIIQRAYSAARDA